MYQMQYNQRGRRPKNVNFRYFDYPTKKSWYVLGLFAACYSGCGQKGIYFSTHHSGIADLVHTELEFEHELLTIERPGSLTYRIQVSNALELRSRLENIGLNSDKHKRRFPDGLRMPYLSHFVRGFYDGKAILTTTHQRTSVSFYFNHDFMLRLHNVFMDYAGVQRLPSEKEDWTNIWYNPEDALRIYDFIYKEWDFIENHGIYLPSKRKAFITKIHEKKLTKRQIAAAKRWEIADRLIKRDYSSVEICEILGIPHLTTFYKLVRANTDMTIREYRDLLMD
ncbi:MAG: hypothetical protein V1740_06075 [Candidatus Woesearchaeota archaeon]